MVNIRFIFCSPKTILLLMAGLISVGGIRGQQLAFHHLNIEDGLSNNAVLSITQDRYGFIWLGTANGINRYDGTRFAIYRYNKDNPQSISNNIQSLLTYAAHTLWVGTSSGLNRYIPEKDAFERVQIPGTQNNLINCLYEDRHKNLWVGTGNGLFLLGANRQWNQVQAFYNNSGTQSLAGNNIRCVYEDHAGAIWVGTANGLTRMQLLNGNWQYNIYRNMPSHPGSLSANYVTAIMEDGRQQLWIGTQNNGVNRYDATTGQFSRFTHSNNHPAGLINNNIRKIITDREGNLWVGTQEGLSIIDQVTYRVRSYQHDPGNRNSLSQHSIYSIYQDDAHSMWIGTYFGGVNISYASNTFFSVIQNNENKASISNNVISSMVEDPQHNLWIGTEGGGLNYLNRTTGAVTVYKNKVNDPYSIGSNLVKAVYLDRDGQLWAGTHGGGLNLFDPSTKQFRRQLFRENEEVSLIAEVISLYEDRKGRFWAGTNQGLKLFQKNKTELVPKGNGLLNGADRPKLMSPDKLVNCFWEDTSNQLWAGTSNGLYKVTGNTVKEINAHDEVNCITADKRGNLWFGLTSGLGYYNIHTGNYTHYTRQNDLPNNNVIGILEDSLHNLWLSSDNGLVKFNPASHRSQTYTSSDGIAANAFNYRSFLKDSKGTFFFGGYNGITTFLPDQIETNQQKAPIQFTGLRLFNAPIDIGDEHQLLKQNMILTREIRVQHDQNVFTIEYALLNYIKSNKNRYAYKLEGIDKDWNETNAASVTYTNLPTGHYRFLVKGTNNDGIWSDPVALSILVLPPFWLTRWAYGVYILLLLVVLFLINRFFFFRTLLKKEEELHQVKLNFFTNVSHEIRTHLTLIMAPVEKMLEGKQADSFAQQQLTHIKTNAARLLKLVSELMDFRKAETHHLQLKTERHDLVSFLEEIYTSFREVSLAKNISLSFIHNCENCFVYFDPEQLEKVFFNLLTNAFKFTPEGGRIAMSLEQCDNQVTVQVTDNGRGIAPQYLDKLFTNFFQVADHGQQNTGYGIGLALAKNIVELHKGSITVQSKPAMPHREGRTSFTVTLQQGNKHLAATLVPAGTLPAPITSAPVAPASAVQAAKPVLAKFFSLLVAEDNAELRALLKETFEHEYQLCLCENGLEAWEKATEQIPDLIISDVMMPGMDGFTLCERLKTDERTSHIPVILLTAKSTESDQVSGLETGADIYLTKPFSTRVLKLNVYNLLASRERMRQKFNERIVAAPAADRRTEAPVFAEVLNTVEKEFLEKVMQLVDTHMEDPEFGVDMLARKVAMSPPILYKKLKAVTNMSVNDFVKSLRLKKAAELIRQKRHTVYEVAYMVGYSDRKYFSKEFKKQFGKTPSTYAETEYGEV
jgi:ligand-binding sensor domain-containing protein/signal transduction histidine kinase/DNA-binding response OmpR family regulator